MELMVLPKGSSYVVQDKKDRMLYSIKKKGFGMRYTLLDASGYDLYSLLQTDESRKPIFKIILNDDTFMEMRCITLFLNPTMECEGSGMKFTLKSKDMINFDIIKNGNNVGSILLKSTITEDLSFDIIIENVDFDDYIPLFAVAIEKTFGDISKELIKSKAAPQA